MRPAPPRVATRTTGQFSCKCGRQWNALGEVHCTVCHEHFSGYGPFDIHLRGWHGGPHSHPGDCRAPETGRALLARENTLLGTIWRGAQ